jgi:hypothetical protein
VSNTFAYFGYSQPRDIASIQAGVDLLKRHLRVNAMFDYKGGYSILNQTANIQCAQSNSCPGASKRDATLEEQAANIATRNSNPSTAVGFLQNGALTRFRELSATVTLPKSLSSRMRAVLQWTSYTGPDPEANYSQNDVQNTYSTSGQRTYFTFRVALHY